MFSASAAAAAISVKLSWWDGDGPCLLAKRLERGRFVRPRAEEGVVVLSRAQLSTSPGGDRLADAAPEPGGRSWPAEPLGDRLRQIDSTAGLRTDAAADLIQCERADHAR